MITGKKRSQLTSEDISLCTKQIRQEYEDWLSMTKGSEKDLASVSSLRPFSVEEYRTDEGALSIEMTIKVGSEKMCIGCPFCGNTKDDEKTRKDAALLLLYISKKMDDLQPIFIRNRHYHNDIVREYFKRTLSGTKINRKT